MAAMGSLEAMTLVAVKYEGDGSGSCSISISGDITNISANTAGVAI